MRKDVKEVHDLIADNIGPGDVLTITDFLDAAPDHAIAELRERLIDTVNKNCPVEGKVSIPDKKEADNFDILEDRVLSLLYRWKKFKKENPDKVSMSIKGFLQEVNDEYTK